LLLQDQDQNQNPARASRPRPRPCLGVWKPSPTSSVQDQKDQDKTKALKTESINQSINQSIIVFARKKSVTIKASKTKYMSAGQQGKTLTASL